jgi:WD40 repeat protein
MRNLCLGLIAVAGSVAVVYGQQSHVIIRADFPYAPAFVSTTTAAVGHTELVIFPLIGGPSKIPIRTASGPFAYSPDGKALYGQCSTTDSGAPNDNVRIVLCRIELKTGVATPLPGSIGLYARDIAVSPRQDCILVSGVLRRGKDTRGLFELSLTSGKIRTVIAQNQRPTRSDWTYVSLAPDGKRAVGSYNGRVEVIDMVQGRAELLDDGLFMAAWSPDGKWLAAVEKGEKGHTLLMDAATLKRTRILGPSELGWSPDSHYLLGFKSCNSYYGTIEVIDIDTGDRIAVKSSECQINQATTGWVSSDLAAK